MNTVPAARGGGEDAVARVDGRRERLLEQHVQSRVERLGRDRLVQVVRNRDERGVEVAVRERGAPATRTASRSVRSAMRCAFAASGSTAAVTVIGTFGAIDRVEVPVRDRAAADDRHAQTLAHACSIDHREPLEVEAEPGADRVGVEAESARAGRRRSGRACRVGSRP